MTRSIVKFLLIGALISTFTTQASAQGFATLMQKLSQIETRINDIESANRQSLQQVEKKLASVQTPQENSTTKESFNEIQTRIERLEQANSEKSKEAPEVTELVSDIRSLIGTLRQVSETPTQTASKPATTQKDAFEPGGKISGYMFGDYYYLAQASGNKISAVSGAKSTKNSGFAFRRIYLQYDHKVSPHLSTRLRFEAKDAGFGKSDKMSPTIKNAYMKYSRNGHTFHTGLIGSPTWSVSEKAWGYRSVEKTILDLNKAGSSTDLGFAYEGIVDSKGKVKVHAMIGNGSGGSPESDNHKKFYLRTTVQPTKAVTVSAYADWETKPNNQDKYTLSSFVGLKHKAFQGGVEGFWRINKNAANNTDESMRGLSAFGTASLSAKTKLFGRVDVVDPSNQAQDDKKYLFISGLDISPVKGVHMMPNIWVQAYEEDGAQTDVVPRMTFYYKF